MPAFRFEALDATGKTVNGLVDADNPKAARAPLPTQPLGRARTARADEAEAPRQRELVAHLRAEVNAGSPFARALVGSPREFDEVYCGVVAAGEQSGQLGGVLDKLANDLEEQQGLKSKLTGGP